MNLFLMVIHTAAWSMSIRRPMCAHMIRHLSRDLTLTTCQTLHASAFVSQISVRSLTDPPPSTLKEPAVVSTYPFAITLTTDKPFLAEVTLSVVGERNSDIVLQHWVEVRAVDLRISYAILTRSQAGLVQA